MGTALRKGPPGARTHPGPEAGACLPCTILSGETALHQGLSQKRQHTRPGRRSAVKHCVSHKGGSPQALLGEIRERGARSLLLMPI